MWQWGKRLSHAVGVVHCVLLAACISPAMAALPTHFFIGLGKDMSSHIKMEVGYLNQSIRRINAADYHGNDLSLNWFGNFN